MEFLFCCCYYCNIETILVLHSPNVNIQHQHELYLMMVLLVLPNGFYYSVNFSLIFKLNILENSACVIFFLSVSPSLLQSRFHFQRCIILIHGRLNRIVCKIMNGSDYFSNDLGVVCLCIGVRYEYGEVD